MEHEKQPPLWHTLFEASIALRAVHALTQLVSGVVLYLTSTTAIYNLANHITARELSEDPNSLVSNFIMNHAAHITIASKDFAALYFFVAATMNAVLVFGLYFHKRIMFPIAQTLLACFAVYEMYLFTHSLSWWLVALAFYDAVTIWLIHMEYLRRWGGTVQKSVA